MPNGPYGSVLHVQHQHRVMGTVLYVQNAFVGFTGSHLYVQHQQDEVIPPPTQTRRRLKVSRYLSSQ